jgi:phosphoglycerate kinase
MAINIRTLSDIKFSKGLRVLVRLDLNVPIAKGKVMNDYRIRMALPTINFLLKGGAKVILMSHLEVPKGEDPTLKPVAVKLGSLGVEVRFVEDYKKAPQIISEMGAGQCILIENLRNSPGEKANDPEFAKELASLADIYVNDAFSVCHREHASVVGVPQYIPSYVGLQMQREMTELSKAFHPDHPFLFILGGAKFDTKLPLFEKFIKVADFVFVGGALAHDFFKEKGYKLGKSLVSEAKIDLSGYLANPRLLLPIDVVTRECVSKPPNSIEDNEEMVDAGLETVAILKEKIDRAEFILWNGPLGLYEGGYKGATLEVARLIADRAHDNKAVQKSDGATPKDVPVKEGNLSGKVTTIVGGGDTLAAIAELDIENKFTFVSTAGGAMLDFLANGSLPGIDVLNIE